MANRKVALSRSMVILALVLLAVLITTVGCDLFGGVSTDERVSDFMSDLAGGRWSNMRSHVHPNVEGRSLMGSSYFDAAFIGTRYSEVSRTGSGNTRNVTASEVGNPSVTITIFFRTSDSGRDAYIDRLERGGVQIVPVNHTFVP